MFSAILLSSAFAAWIGFIAFLNGFPSAWAAKDVPITIAITNMNLAIFIIFFFLIDYYKNLLLKYFFFLKTVFSNKKKLKNGFGLQETVNFN